MMRGTATLLGDRHRFEGQQGLRLLPKGIGSMRGSYEVISGYPQETRNGTICVIGVADIDSKGRQRRYIGGLWRISVHGGWACSPASVVFTQAANIFGGL